VVIILGTAVSVIKTLVVPRRAWSFVPRLVNVVTTRVFMGIARRMRSYDLVDRFLGFLGPLVLIFTLLAWLGLFVIGFALILLPTTDNFGRALAQSGSSTFTLGISAREPGVTTSIDVIASATGLIVIALTIAYLPALYAVIRRRETLGKQLQVRIDSPAWGPNVLASHHRLGADDVLPTLYADWDRWACEVADGHAKYPVLNQFRLPRSRHNWLLSLTAMMDAAALDVSLRRDAPPEARLFLRSGIACVDELATSLRIGTAGAEPPLVGESDFEEAVALLAEAGCPGTVPASESWSSFHEWRSRYGPLAHAIADTVVAPPAPWTGGRSIPTGPANH
jgi:hypothetical protein